MSAEETGKAQEEAGGKKGQPERQQSCMEMCRQMMAGGMPDCCGPETRGMMAQWMQGLRAKEQK